jgi:perosamine synthetase
MEREEFARSFSEHIHFKPNRFHPLVWINGDPEVGENVYIGGMSEVNAKGARVRIGDNCDIASFVSINCADSHRLSIGIGDAIDRRDITLEENVFVGSHCVIKGGAHIGHHSVVAAGTIVEGRKIPPYSLVIGNPMIVKDGYYDPARGQPGPVPHNRPTLGAEEERAAVETLRSGYIAQGRQVKALEDEFCAFLGLEPGHAVAVSSGSAALFLALHVLEARDRSVAIPAYVCSSLLHACSLADARPVLLDNAPGSPNVDLGALAASAAIVPHMYGIPADLSGAKGPFLIEDCAQAVGARVRGVPVGLQGDVGVFSFYATKLMTSGGQGGMLVSKERSRAEAARDYREFDQRRDCQSRFNFQMTDLQAAIGREQLKKLPAFLAKRREIYAAYREAGLDLLDAAGPGLEPVRFRAVMRHPDPARVIAALEAAGIRAIVPLEEWELLGDADAYPNARDLCRSTLSLPLYPSLANRDRDAIIGVLKAL